MWQALYGQYFDRMACEGKSLTARDLAEIMAKTHHPEGQDAREGPVERESEGDVTFQHSGGSLGQRAPKGSSGLKSYGSRLKLSHLCPVTVIYAQQVWGTVFQGMPRKQVLNGENQSIWTTFKVIRYSKI